MYVIKFELYWILKHIKQTLTKAIIVFMYAYVLGCKIDGIGYHNLKPKDQRIEA